MIPGLKSSHRTGAVRPKFFPWRDVTRQGTKSPFGVVLKGRLVKVFTTLDPAGNSAKWWAGSHGFQFVSSITARCAGLLLIAVGTLPLPARAIDGCLLVLCQGAPDWRVIPECVPPMLKALDDLARGIPFPPCASAEEVGAEPSRVGAWPRNGESSFSGYRLNASAEVTVCEPLPVHDIASWRVALPLSSDLVRP